MPTITTDAAALVSIEDLELLEQLEDEADAREATRVLREMEESGEAPISLIEMKRSLGLWAVYEIQFAPHARH